MPPNKFMLPSLFGEAGAGGSIGASSGLSGPRAGAGVSFTGDFYSSVNSGNGVSSTTGR